MRPNEASMHDQHGLELCPSSFVSPLPDDEVERRESLCQLGILDSGADPAFDRLTQLAAQVFGTRFAYVSFVDTSRQWLKSELGLGIKETPRNIAFCAYTILSEEVLVVPDARNDERFRDSPLVTGAPHLRFYAGAPIISITGHKVGTLCVADTEPKTIFTETEKSILATLANLVSEAAETHRRNQELRLTEQDARDRYALVTRATLDGVWDWDLTNDSVYYSPRWQYLLGLEEVEVVSGSDHWLGRVHAQDRPLVEEEMKRHLSGKTSRFRSEHRIQHGDGTWRWVVVRGLVQRGRSGQLIRFAGSLMDITGDKTSDPLTGLPNRLLFNDRLCRLIKRSEVSQEWRFAVLFLDVDRFKQINDRFGHIVGDRILLTIAQRLTEEIRQTRLNQESLVARFAGDEFVVLLDGVENEEQAKAVAERLHAAVIHPISCQGDQVRPQVSIGITMAAADLTTPESFLQSSDTAMYQVKAAGGGGSTVFDPRMQAETLARCQLEFDLRMAVEKQQLRVFYQPQIDLLSGQLIGCEALVRWQHPSRGLLAPGDFIPLAEEVGLIEAIDLWVLETACRQVSSWRKTSGLTARLRVSVNLSSDQFSHRDLPLKIKTILESVDLPASALCLEITETVFMKDVSGSVSVMKALRTIGVGLHMDDFGSGYSSFKQLHELPFDTLKIDRSFMSTIVLDAQAKNVVQAILGLANLLRMDVIAEGVESVEQAQLLTYMGCAYAQGYFFSRPLAVDSFERYVENNRNGYLTLSEHVHLSQ